jgi:hypothetical protein
VSWARSRRPPDLTLRIRQAFGEADCTETAFHAPDDVLLSVGACRFQREPQPLQTTPLFTFITERAGTPTPRRQAEARLRTALPSVQSAQPVMRGCNAARKEGLQDPAHRSAVRWAYWSRTPSARSMR